ncbi:MAG: TlpA family protein disulfide reductase [Bacteroidetes bacterium]|nr:TlpA family protein disulfide reductase [Bacteroidota bacterium]
MTNKITSQLFLLLAFCSIVCAQENDGTVEFVLDKKGNTTNYAIYWNNFWLENPIIYENESSEVIQTTSQFPLRVISIETQKENSNGLNTSFVVYPNEVIEVYKENKGSVKMKILNNDIRTNELAFFSEMNKKVGEFEGYMVGSPPKNSDMSGKIKYFNDIYNNRIAFLNDYVSKNKMTELFIDYLKNAFLFKKLNDQLELIAYSNKVNIEDENNLLKDGFPVNEQYYYLNEYRNSALTYIRLLAKREKKPNRYETWLDITSKTFTGNTRDITLFGILKVAQAMKFDSLYHLAEKAASKISNSDIRKYVNENIVIQKNIAKINEELDINSIGLLSHSGEQVSFKDILKSSNKQLFYVDFWASWCGPCISEIKSFQSKKGEFNNDKLGFIYISLDQNVVPWKKSAEKNGITEKSSFLLPGGTKSSLAKKFNIFSIPRYLLIDKEGIVLDANSLRPSDSKIVEYLNKF